MVMRPPGRQTRTSSGPGRKHRPKHGHHGIKAGVGIGHLLGIALLEANRQPFAVRPGLGLFDQVGGNVDARHLRTAARGWDGQVAGAAGHIQDLFAGLEVQALDKFGGTRFIRFGNLTKVAGHPSCFGAGGKRIRFHGRHCCYHVRLSCL